MTAAYVLVKIEATRESIARGVALLQQHVAPTEVVLSVVGPRQVAELDQVVDRITRQRKPLTEGRS